MDEKSLDINVRYIKGVGEAREKKFEKLGIKTLSDLVSYFPRAYEDRTQFKLLNGLTVGETVCVLAMAATAPQLSHIRKGLDIVKLRAVDEVGTLELTFFNQPYIKDSIKPGESYVFYGKVEGTLTRPAMVNPLFEKVMQGDLDSNPALRTSITGRIMPVYPLTAGISQKMLFTAVRSGLDKCGDELPDILPDDIVREYELCRARYAYENIHFPEDMKALELARKRLIFEELFVLITAMKLLRDRRSEKTGRRLIQPDWNEFYGAFDFKPTGAQVRAVEDAARDMESEKAMNRLIQ
ncbi:MAG: ATP-dependent DNA helicase RecG, partial [Oscillospiraceae bacterium]|nr:ATP-dependent DNA helicase RecG [Oscillospiraceae bacterium]